MFDDLMGNLQKQQEEIQKKLADKPVVAEVEGIRVEGNAAKKVNSVSINEEILKSGDKEMLEELLAECFNRFMENAIKIEAEETKNIMDDLLPPGFEDLFKQ